MSPPFILASSSQLALPSVPACHCSSAFANLLLPLEGHSYLHMVLSFSALKRGCSVQLCTGAMGSGYPSVLCCTTCTLPPHSMVL